MRSGADSPSPAAKPAPRTLAAGASSPAGESVLGLYQRHRAAICARCRRLLGDDARAEDLAQEVFLRLVRDPSRAPDPEGALSWLYRVATNLCLNEVRSARRRARFAARCGDQADALAGEEALAARELTRRIAARTPRRLTVSAVLYHVDGMSHEEVARALGMSRRTVIYHLAQFRARARRAVGGGRDGDRDDDSARLAAGSGIPGHADRGNGAPGPQSTATSP